MSFTLPVSRRTLLRIAPATALGAGLGLSVAACGTTDPPTTGGTAGSDGGGSDGGGSDDGGSDGGGAITLTDGAGRTVSLPGPASKVVALEWNSVEDALGVGADLVGVSDPAGYATWGSTVTIPGSATDVGLRTEPSLEAIAGLAPDLILGITESVPENALEQMRSIAPVLLLTGADATRPIELMRENHLTTGRAVGKEQQAQQNLEDFDAEVETASGPLSGVDGPYVFLYPFAQGGQVTFRVHGSRSLPGAVAESAGLTNAWTEPGDDGWGLGSLDLEALTTLPADTHILTWGNAEDGPVMETLGANEVWKNLPSVQAGRVHRVGVKNWLYGGPASQIAWLRDLVDTLA